MRYLDIAVALLVGTGAIVGLAAWSPSQGDAVANVYAVRSTLYGELGAFVQDEGVAVFIGQGGPACSALASHSNFTSGLAATIGGVSCGILPPSSSVDVSLTFQIATTRVTLWAWSTGAA